MIDNIDEPIDDNLDSAATGNNSEDARWAKINEQLARAKLYNSATNDISPEQANSAMRMGKQLNIPPMLALENQSLLNKGVFDLVLDRLPADYPAVLDYVSRDPMLFASSKDEIEQLQAIEQQIKNNQRDWDEGRGVDSMGARVLGNLNVLLKSRSLENARGTDSEQAYANALEQVVQQRESMPRHPGLDAAMARAQRESARGNTAGWWKEMIGGVLSADGADAAADMLAESLVTMFGGTAIDAILAAGALTSDPGAALKGVATGVPAARAAKVWQGLSDAARKKTAQAGAVAATAGVGTYEGAYPSYLVEGFGKEEFKGLPIIERARAAQKYAETKAQTEGLVNAAVSPLGVLVPGGIVAKAAGLGASSAAAGGVGAYAAAKSVGENASPEDLFLETILEVPGAAVDVGAATWGERKAQAYNDRLKATIERAGQMEKTLLALSSSASNLASRERSPGTLAQFVDMAIEQHGTVPPELGIGARHLLEAVGEEGVADLRSKSERFDQQIDEAMQNDGEIVLDTSELVEWSAGLTPEQQKVIAENVREHDGALTVAEAEEAKAELERFNQEAAADVADEDAADGDYIFEKFHADLVAADKERARLTGIGGMSDATNARYAELMKHAMVTIAKRAGMKPRELFDRFYGGVSATEGGGSATTKVDAKNKRATIDDFRPENIGNVLNKTHWAIISAMNPAGETAPDAENKANHDRLIAKLRDKGYEFVESVGNYGGILENSVVVTGISEIEADALGREFGQDSVLSPRGYIYGKDTTLRPISGPAEVFSTAPSDNYTSIPSLGSNFTFPIDWNMTPQPTTLLPQSVPLRRGTQTLRKYGLDPSKRHNTRDVAAALEARQRDKYGSIPAEFESEEQRLEAEKKIARWMAEEVEFEMEDPANTATGWYSEKFQRALDIMAEVYPELKTDKVARDTLTLLIAITSDGQKVQGNFLQAMDIYGNYRTGGATEGRFTTGRGHQRQASINNNLSIIQRLHDTMGAEKMHQYLMQEKTVKELKKAARDAGGKFDSAYLVTETVPMAALELGEKLGAFYANLMGAHGYLTMDRWWSRTFNRYRGTLLTNATPESLAKFRETIGRPEISDDETLAATIPYRNALAARGYKTRLAILMDRTSQPQGKAEADAWLAEARARAGDQFDELYKEHVVERSANTIYKEAFEKLNDIPFNGSDRSFMIAATKRAQKLLKRRGIDTSVADIQAILWYYEKQLYGDLGARQSGKLSYEEASRRVVDAVRSGNAADLAAVRAGVGEESDEDGVSLGDEEYRVDDTKVDQLAYRGDVKGRVAFTRDAKAESRTGRQLNGWGLYLSSSEASAQGYAGTTGEVYRFEIPDNDALMDFDTGVGYRSQPQQVVDALLRLSNRLDNAELADKLRKSLRTPGGKFTGEALYRELTDEEFFGNQKAASLALYEVGILGHKYTTPTRGADAVTPPEDFVIYNGADARLLTKDEVASKLNQFEQGDLFEEAKSIEEQERAQAEAKGLDMSTEARMARAKEMGFATSRRWYHASRKAGFRKFNLPDRGKTAGTGVFMTDSSRMAGTYMPGLSREARIGRPDEIVANPDAFGFEITETEFGEFLVGTPDGYEQVFQSRQEMMDFLRDDARFSEEPGMYELFVRLDPQNVLTIDWQGRNWSDGPTETVWNIYDKDGDIIDTVYSQAEAEEAVDSLSQAVEFRQEEQQLYETTDDAARRARDMGYDAVEIINVEDPGPYSSRIGAVEGTTLVVFDPANIRSTNAAFDPAFSDSADLLAQEPKAKPTGKKRGSFDVRTFRIALMDPNKTTTLHELGHMFFEMMVHLAAEPNAPKQIVDDVNAMLKFLDFPGSAADYLKVPVPQRKVGHETMAEHFEAYLRSGKAPTVELQGLFRTFARFLIEAYGALTRMIGVGKLGNVDMDPELRAIFDRMLATDEAIEQSAKVRALMPQFETAEQAGMTAEEFAEYQSRNSDVLDGAAEDLRAKLIRDMRWLNRLRDKTLRELTADAKAKRKAIRDEVTAEVDRMRVYRVMHFLKRGVMLDENGAEVQAPWLIESSKLNKAAVEALFPNGEVDVAKLGFGKYGMVSANGVDPGVIAGLFGYQSADEMVRDIVGAEPRGQLIDGMTEQRMLERYAEIATPEDLQKAADEAIASEAHTRMVATELAALDARQGKVSVLRKAAKYAAMGILGRRTVRNLRPDLSASAATRSRKDSAKALAAGKRDEAAAAKRNELLHVELERQGREAKREIEAFLRATKKVWKGGADKVAKSRDVDLVMAARMVLGRYGIGSPAGMAAAANYVAMLAKYDGPHQQQVLQMTQGLPAPKDYKDLTLDEIRHVADIALGLYQMALDEKTMTIDGQKVAIDAVADRIVEGVKAKHGGQMPSDRATKRTPTPWDEKVDALRSLKANLSRVEFWAGNMGAVFKEAILQPVLESITKYRARRSRMIKAYKGLLDEIAPTLTFKPITCKPGELMGEDGKPFTFSAGLSEVIHAILHTGNESNKRKLMLGRGWATENADGTLSHPGWDAFIARLVAEGALTKDHFDFCQKVWDLLDSMKQDAQAAHKAVYGFYFHEITANELQTPFGTYRGGYVPAIPDPRDVSESESKKDAEELLQSGNSFAFPTAPTGFTKQRVEYNRALHLDLRVLASHIDKVCRFTDVQPAVRDVAKLLMNKRVANALNRHDKKVINNMLIPWLQVSANQVTTRPGKDRTFDKFIGTVDSRTGMAIMFASVINTLQQSTGFSAALVRTDENGNYLATSPEMLRQIAAYMSGPKDYVALAVSRSAWLDDRMHNQTMEMRGAIDDILVNASVIQKTEAFFARNAYFLQVAFQNMIDPIVFNAAYETAIARGATEKQARRAGEELIRTTLGTFAPEDVSAVEINTPIVRSMLKFYGFFNMWGNLLGSEASKALRQAGYMEPSKRLAFLWFAGLAMPAYVASLMAGNLPDDEDDEDGDGMLDEYLADFFGVQGRSLAAMVPGVGPITNFVVNLHNDKPYDDRLNVSPLMSTIESAVKSSDNLLRGEYFDEEVTKREVRDMSTLIAIATGIPTGPLAKMYGYEKDLESGRIEERGALGDVWGYATGK